MSNLPALQAQKNYLIPSSHVRTCACVHVFVRSKLGHASAISQFWKNARTFASDIFDTRGSEKKIESSIGHKKWIPFLSD